MGPKAEARREEALFAMYERDCDAGFEGSFADWYSDFTSADTLRPEALGGVLGADLGETATACPF